MARDTHLVTGGCGFVGRRLVHRLLRDGASVWLVDDLSTGKPPDEWLPEGFSRTEVGGRMATYRSGSQSVTFVRADALRVFLAEADPSVRPSPDLEPVSLPDFHTVFHLASIVGGRSMIDGDPLKVGIDLGIDAAMFLWASRPERRKRLGRILYASSSAAYPIHLQAETEHIALKEEYISFDQKLGQPDMTYGWSKLTGEFLARLAAARYGLHLSCIRPFSGYGEDQDLTYPVPAIAARIARRENPVEVWGTGNQGRDFIHIDDCVDAMLVVADHVQDGDGVNIGTGKLTSFNDLIRLFGEIAGYTPTIKTLLDKPVGVQSRYAVPDRIHSFGWRPAISLRDGMTRVLRAAEARLRS